MNNRTNNEALTKALGHLSHPITLVSITILLINDWCLRIIWPSWLTGKIGDFAWMFFFPFVLAVLLSIIIPAKLGRQDEHVKVLAFLFAFLIFTLPKTIPAVNSSLNNLLETIIGVPTNIRRDPTDLLALFSLGLAWKFWDIDIQWQKAKAVPGVISLQLAVLLTIANAPAQDFGIDSLEIDQGQVIAHSAYFKFISEDGGLTWEQAEFSYYEHSQNAPGDPSPITIDYIPGEVIKISKDGGGSFPYEYSLIPTNQPLRLKYERRNGSPVFEQGPLDAVTDPITGNIIFAMGHEGILVFTDNNSWEWVSVNEYQRLEYDPKSELVSLILGEVFLSIGFGLLVLNTFTVGIHHGLFRKVLLMLGWGVFLLNILILPPGLISNQQAQPYYSIFPIISYIAHSVGLIVFLILGILDMIKIRPKASKTAGNILFISLIEIVIFITPYTLWGFTVIPKYSTAAILAVSIGALGLIGFYLVMYKSLDSLFHEIRSRNENAKYHNSEREG